MFGIVDVMRDFTISVADIPRGVMWAFTATGIIYLILYLANIRPFGNVGLYHPIGLPLLLLGSLMFARCWGWADLAAMCLIAWLIFLAAMGNPNLGAAVEVMALAGISQLVRRLPAVWARALPQAFFVFLCASCLMFVLSVTTRWGFDMRKVLYAGAVIDRSQLELSEADWFHQGGLTLYLFSFGYHVAAAVPISLALAASSIGWGRVLWSLAALITLFCLIAAGQRSALLAAGIGIVALLPLARWRTQFMVTVLLVLTIALFIGSATIQGATGNRAGVVARLIAVNSDIDERLAVQKAALSVIGHHPLGLTAYNRSYAGTIRAYGASMSIAPHNAYLTRAVSHGWTALIVVFVLLIIVFINALGTWKRSWRRLDKDNTRELLLLSGLVAVLANAGFHNGGLLSLSSHTLAPLMLYLGWCDRDCPEEASCDA